MVGGPSAGRRLLAVGAVLCAISGLVLVAGAMGPLTAASPASDVFGDALEDRAAGKSPIPSAAGGGSGGGSPGGGSGSGSLSGGSGGGTGGGSIGAGGSVGSGSGGSVPGSGLLEGVNVANNPLVGGVFGELLSLSGGGAGFGGGSDGGGSGGDGSGTGGGSTGDGSGTDGGSGGDGSGTTDGATTEQSESDSDGRAAAARGEGGSESADTTAQDGGDETGDSPLPDEIGSASSSPAVTAALVGAAVLVVGYVFYTRDDPIGTLLSLPGRLVSVALAGVVACSQALERAVAAVRDLRSIADLPGLVLAAISDAIRSARRRVRDTGSSLSASLFGGGDETKADTATADHATARERIRRAFESVIDASPMYRSRVATATPTDVARSATDAGAPDDPVETITDSFRDVEYGDRDPDAYLERTTTAHERLRGAIASMAETEGEDADPGAEPRTEAGSDE